MPLAYMFAKEFPPRNFAVLAIEEIQSSTKTVMDGVINVQSNEGARVVTSRN
jgi:flagellar biosynthesis protein FlhA